MSTTQDVVRAVVPAAGFGSRLRPLTQAFPKELLPIGRQPVLAHVVAELAGAGITDVCFIVSERKPQIRAFFGDTYAPEGIDLPPVRCEYLIQETQKGSGDAVLRAADAIGSEPFVVAFGDCLIEGTPDSSAPLRRLITTFQEKQASAAVLVEQVAREKVARYGVLAPAEPLPKVPTEPFAASDIVEKPAPEDAPSNLVVAARFVFTPALFACLRRIAPDPRGEQNLPDAIRLLLQQGGTLQGVPLRPGEARRDIGNFETFYANFLRAALRDPEYGANLRRLLHTEFAE